MILEVTEALILEVRKARKTGGRPNGVGITQAENVAQVGLKADLEPMNENIQSTHTMTHASCELMQKSNSCKCELMQGCDTHGCETHGCDTHGLMRVMISMIHEVREIM